jgi:hypothetical protein
MFLTIPTGRSLPKVRQPREPEPSTINEKTIADSTRVVEQAGISSSSGHIDRRHWGGG